MNGGILVKQAGHIARKETKTRQNNLYQNKKEYKKDYQKLTTKSTQNPLKSINEHTERHI